MTWRAPPPTTGAASRNGAPAPTRAAGVLRALVVVPALSLVAAAAALRDLVSALASGARRVLVVALLLPLVVVACDGRRASTPRTDAGANDDGGAADAGGEDDVDAGGRVIQTCTGAGECVRLVVPPEDDDLVAPFVVVVVATGPARPLDRLALRIGGAELTHGEGTVLDVEVDPRAYPDGIVGVEAVYELGGGPDGPTVVAGAALRFGGRAPAIVVAAPQDGAVLAPGFVDVDAQATDGLGVAAFTATHDAAVVDLPPTGGVTRLVVARPQRVPAPSSIVLRAVDVSGIAALRTVPLVWDLALARLPAAAIGVAGGGPVVQVAQVGDGVAARTAAGHLLFWTAPKIDAAPDAAITSLPAAGPFLVAGDATFSWRILDGAVRAARTVAGVDATLFDALDEQPSLDPFFDERGMIVFASSAGTGLRLRTYTTTGAPSDDLFVDDALPARGIAAAPDGIVVVAGVTALADSTIVVADAATGLVERSDPLPLGLQLVQVAFADGATIVVAARALAPPATDSVLVVDAHSLATRGVVPGARVAAARRGADGALRFIVDVEGHARMYVERASGVVEVFRTLDAAQVDAPPTVGPPWIFRTRSEGVVVGTTDYAATGVDDDGDVRWVVDLGGPDGAAFSLNDGAAVFASPDGTVELIDAAGSTAWIAAATGDGAVRGAALVGATVYLTYVDALTGEVVLERFDRDTGARAPAYVLPAGAAEATRTVSSLPVAFGADLVLVPMHTTTPNGQATTTIVGLPP